MLPGQLPPLDAERVGNMRLCIRVWNSYVPWQRFAFSPRDEGSAVRAFVVLSHQAYYYYYYYYYYHYYMALTELHKYVSDISQTD